MIGKKILVNSARVLDEIDKKLGYDCPECEDGVSRKTNEYPSQDTFGTSREVYECSDCSYERRPHKGPGMFEKGVHEMLN